ncbi:IS110 family transposase [Ralstonia pseudosolanacearum]|uniref:IS110 family transposase n=2 Tax=Ralstonia pseudosolanacearum TaxID=1310165 RepID=UPI0026771DEE|nr:IS110 family transposase [Ralstonia pseudosolanacearum]MDO3530263.1 IS110 family transposase [Ralstonia pseudosolanacearum]MDO3535137.1 IS110 family transposase [Ralstonia pseudosolanacearum]MDO3564541.1 IS110 family transposase [Ralstonia pseudosolanacearum]MDO3574330.1 IS110 family transposase [Ralstonia pseudosolanacearum]MDO3618115.1 IS110 family transposase [Ralstonia pseudosolanacearum]
MKLTVIGMDIAKHVFQLHVVNPSTGEIERIKLRRSQLLEFFAKRERSVVAMEACGGAHHWARELLQLGHDVKLICPRSVRPFVLRNKSDAADARAIWTAVQQPEARLVAVKSEAQQTILALHRLRAQLMKFRIMQTNALRGLLHEFGEALPEGYQALSKEIPAALAKVSDRLPAMLIDSLREQWARVQATDKDINLLEHRLKLALRDSQQCQRIAEIPGIGLLTATAAVATIGDPHTFRSGREFAAWLGLVPKQVGTGGKVRQLGLSKRGDTYLRTLLMHGARSVITRGTRSPWLDGLLARRPFNVVVAALANKLARTIWAVLSRGTPYHGAA